MQYNSINHHDKLISIPCSYHFMTSTHQNVVYKQKRDYIKTKLNTSTQPLLKTQTSNFLKMQKM
jgi:hypothetical protein